MFDINVATQFVFVKFRFERGCRGRKPPATTHWVHQCPKLLSLFKDKNYAEFYLKIHSVALSKHPPSRPPNQVCNKPTS